MIYKCDNPYCGFLFERVGEVDCCPDCGHDDIRSANEEELEIFNLCFEVYDFILST